MVSMRACATSVGVTRPVGWAHDGDHMMGMQVDVMRRMIDEIDDVGVALPTMWMMYVQCNDKNIHHIPTPSTPPYLSCRHHSTRQWMENEHHCATLHWQQMPPACVFVVHPHHLSVPEIAWCWLVLAQLPGWWRVARVTSWDARG